MDMNDDTKRQVHSENSCFNQPMELHIGFSIVKNDMRSLADTPLDATYLVSLHTSSSILGSYSMVDLKKKNNFQECRQNKERLKPNSCEYFTFHMHCTGRQIIYKNFNEALKIYE